MRIMISRIKFTRLLRLFDLGCQLVSGMSKLKFNWQEDVAGSDHSYGPSLLSTTEVSLVSCLMVCSFTVKCKAATYNNKSGACSCIEHKISVTEQLGNDLWNRYHDGFVYNVQLGWYIRLFVDIKVTRAEAETFCGTLGARLAVLDTYEKINDIVGLPNFQSENVIYVDAKYNETEDAFLWSTGVPTTNWNPNEPNNATGDERCVALWAYGFVDLPCTFLCSFLCEII